MLKVNESKISLKEDEVLCPNCEGAQIEMVLINNKYQADICRKCLGTGKLDWMEMILGKNSRKAIRMTASAKHIYETKYKRKN